MKNQITLTPIKGLEVFDLKVHEDQRGWFKENWKNDFTNRITNSGFVPVQNNVSMNLEIGTIRGMHAEPWDKYVSVASGRVHGAWVDLRDGEGFGKVFELEITPEVGVFVPAGVANGFQALDKNTSYIYLTNANWESGSSYKHVNLADPDLRIAWPLGINTELISTKDRLHPTLAEVQPIENAPRRILVFGATGQVGKALKKVFPEAVFLSRSEFDFLEPLSLDGSVIENADLVINAAAFTAVDAAETSEFSKHAWMVNASAVSHLANACLKHGVTLVHFSTDYVFDGEKQSPYLESDEFCPINVYGTTKAAGDVAVSVLPMHYIIRTSWVIGEGRNFIEAIRGQALGDKEISVVDDQRGRLTFADDLATFVKYLVVNNPAFGTYNLSCDGPIYSWAEIARLILEIEGLNPARILAINSDEFSHKQKARRPKNSVLAVEKTKSIGFELASVEEKLRLYLQSE